MKKVKKILLGIAVFTVMIGSVCAYASIEQAVTITNNTPYSYNYTKTYNNLGKVHRAVIRCSNNYTESPDIKSSYWATPGNSVTASITSSKKIIYMYGEYL